MRKLALVDLSGNRISHVPDDAFASLRLTTLKLADNNLTVAENAFRGLESSLKNLNLKVSPPPNRTESQIASSNLNKLNDSSVSSSNLSTK